MTITTVGLDADDTLWHNERHFHLTQTRFGELLADHADPQHLAERLLAAERRNIGTYGFGVKGFVLSMIETAIEVTDGRVPAPVIAELLAAGRQMLAEPIELLPGAGAEQALIAGNSMASDVVAPILAGAWGVHLPYGLEWALEAAVPPVDNPRFRRLDRIAALPALLDWIDGC
jgi:putative hydrolase of the HAD superfamily